MASDGKRILHLIGALQAGGAERFVVDLLCALSRQGKEVSLACLLDVRDQAGRDWERRLSEAGVDIRFGPGPRLRPRTVRWLMGELQQPDLALVHVHLYYVEQAYALARLLRRPRCPMVRTIHNTQPPQTLLARWAFRHGGARLSIACGQACYEAHRGRVEGPLVCIPNGIEFDWPVRDPGQRADRLRDLGEDPELGHFLHVGRQFGPSCEHSQKAQDDLIRAWRRDRLGEQNARLHLLGGGPLRGALEELAAGDPSIVFHGVVSNVREWLVACDTFVLPSRWEGLPIAAIEALGSGIACVFSDIQPLREIGDGLAEFSPASDASALATVLAARLGRLDGIPASRVAAFRDQHGIERVASDHLAAYARVT